MRIGKKQVIGSLTADTWAKAVDYITGPALNASTVLYIQGDTISDGATGRTVSVSGSVAVTTSQCKFSTLGRSVNFPGGTTDYLSCADSNDWDFGTGNFTVDWWMKQSAVAGYYRFIIGNRAATSGGATWNYWFVEKFPDSTIHWGYYGSAGNNYSIVSTAVVPDDTLWHHYAFVRSGTGSGQCYVFLDGVDVTDPGYNTDAVDYTNAVGSLWIGGGSGLPTNEFINGQLSGVRITKGAALWTSGFTPDTEPPGPRTYFVMSEVGSLDQYTKLLIHGDIVADSTGKVVTASGSAAVTSDQYRFASIGRSIAFNGTTDFLYAADSADWTFGTEDFTVDFNFRFNFASANDVIFSQSFDGTNYWYISKSSANYLVMISYNGGVQTGYAYAPFTPTVGVWYHLAFVRSGSNFYIFVNGVSQSVTIGTTFGNLADVGNATLTIGQGQGAYSSGYLSEARISKGIARWTSTFTPPTAPYGSNRVCGDADEEYRLLVRQVGGAASSWNNLFFNGDVGANYGYQYVNGTNATATAGRNSYGAIVGSKDVFGSGELGMFDYLIYAKSGYVRTVLCNSMVGATGTTVGAMASIGNVWNDAASNLTKIEIYGGVNSGIGVGSSIELWKKAVKI